MKKKLITNMVATAVLLQTIYSTTTFAVPIKSTVDINTITFNATTANLISENNLEKINTEIANNMIKIKTLKEESIALSNSIKQNKLNLIKIQKEHKILKEKVSNIYRSSYMYTSNENVAEVLLSSKDLSDFYNKYIVIKKILTYEKNTLDEFNESEKKLKKASAILNEKKITLEKNYKEQIRKMNILNTSKKKLEQLLAKKNTINVAVKQQSVNALNEIRLSRGSGINLRANVVSFASSFLGMPYKWGGNNPSTSFDCSGLVEYTYNKFGINVPRVAADQQKVGIDIPLSQAQPGDLVFFGKPAHHVGIYIGNNKMLHAPHTGDYIKISPVGNVTNVKRILL